MSDIISVDDPVKLLEENRIFKGGAFVTLVGGDLRIIMLPGCKDRELFLNLHELLSSKLDSNELVAIHCGGWVYKK